MLNKPKITVHQIPYDGQKNIPEGIIRRCVSDIECKIGARCKHSLQKQIEILYESFTGMEPNTHRILGNMHKLSAWLFQHSMNVAVLSLIIAGLLQDNQAEKQKICAGALLHDIGKLLIPQEILQKPGSLAGDEWEAMRRHCILGYNMVKDLNIHTDSKLIVLQHHERLDGSGYPFGLHSEFIARNAKIIMVADSLDAMTSFRPYKRPQSMKEAVEKISADENKYAKEILAVLKKLTL